MIRSPLSAWCQASLVAACALLGAACAAKQGKHGGVLDYTLSAKELYENAMEQFDDEDCTEAPNFCGSLCFFEALALKTNKIYTGFPISSHCSP